jgi:hypothetical protein
MPPKPRDGEWGESEWAAMKARPLWAFSAMALHAARDDRVPCLVQGAVLRLGVTTFWLALALEGRARAAWQDLRSSGPAAGHARRFLAPARMMDSLRELLERPGNGDCARVAAWSLPDDHKMRSLGLGRMWVVLCPYCEDFHVHSPGEVRRTPHCCAEGEARQYLLEHAGTLPLEHRARFHHASMAALPRLLERWPAQGRQHHHPAEALAA